MQMTCSLYVKQFVVKQSWSQYARGLAASYHDLEQLPADRIHAIDCKIKPTRGDRI